MENESVNISVLIGQAEDGDANSQNELAGIYFSQGAYDKAFLWAKKAAEQKFPPAMANLGRMYYDGVGTLKNAEVAIDLFVKSIGYGIPVPIEDLDINDIRIVAERGNANAQLLLGLCYGDGINIEPNTRESVHWYNNAAKQGQPLAMLILGSLLYNGEKLSRNILSAEMYLSAAIRAGAIKPKGMMSELYEEIAASIPYYLVKFTDKTWAEKLMSGQVYMKTIASFFNEGFENQYRGDTMEGFVHSFGDGHNPYGYITDSKGTHEIGESNIIQDGVIDVLLQREKIFCLYCLDYDERRKCFVSPDPQIKDFGDTAMVILNPQEFLRRVSAAVEKRFTNIDYWMAYKRVLYDVDLSAKMVYSEFHKTIDYSYQREFRIALDLTEGCFDAETLKNVTDFAKLTFPGRLQEDTNSDSIANSITLELGSIHDICALYSIDDFLKAVETGEIFQQPSLLQPLDPPRISRPTFFKPIGHMKI